MNLTQLRSMNKLFLLAAYLIVAAADKRRFQYNLVCQTKNADISLIYSV